MQSYPKTIWEIFSTANFRCQEKFPQTLYHTTAFGCRVPWKSNLARWHRCRFKREVIIMSVWWLQQMSDDTPNVWLKDFFVCVVFFGSPKFFKQAMVSQLEQLDANFGQRYSKGAWFSISIYRRPLCALLLSQVLCQGNGWPDGSAIPRSPQRDV